MKKYEKPIIELEEIEIEDICALSNGESADLTKDDTESGSLGGLGIWG